MSYLEEQRRLVKEEHLDIEDQLKAAQELRERLKQQLQETEAEERKLAEEKAGQVPNPTTPPVTTTEGFPRTPEMSGKDHSVACDTQLDEAGYHPDNQVGIYDRTPSLVGRHESNSALSPTDKLPGDKSVEDKAAPEPSRPISTPVRAPARGCPTTTPPNKPYMKSREIREPLTPTEIEETPPQPGITSDDYPTPPAPSPARDEPVDDVPNECLQYFAQLALGLASSASGASRPEVEPKPVEPAREPAPPAREEKKAPVVPNKADSGNDEANSPAKESEASEDKSNKRQVRMVGRNGRVISESGAEQAIRRLCQPNKRGQKKASQDIVNQFFAGGDSRKELIKLFIESGGNHDVFKRTAELRIQQKRARKESCGGGFYTEEAMKTELGYTAKRIKAIIAYCSHKRRRDTHIRKDKYERIDKYLVETQDTVELNCTREETVDQSLEFEVSGPSSAAFPSGPDGLVESDRPSRKRSKVPDESQDEDSDEDDSDDGMMGEATSDSEDDDDGKTSKTGSKSKSASGRSKRSRHADEIPEDIYNSDEILSQILKSTVKIDGLLHKLGQHGTEEAAQIAKGVDGQKATLIGLHDEIAGFKAEYDADKRLTPEKAKALRAKFRQVEVACSKAAMEHKKLTRTILKKTKEAKPKSAGRGKKPKAKKTSGDDGQEAAPTTPPPRRVSKKSAPSTKSKK